MRTPVLLLLFNRPELTASLLTSLAQVKPERLYVAADGPRPGTPGEEALCLRTRDCIQAIDWSCDVKTLFRDRNLGCGKACYEGVSWFFEQEPEGIILEDDIQPHADFFSFCAAMLERYRGDKRVMHVNGHNFQLGLRRGAASYYFSRFAHIWGWASWARAWRRYDRHMPRLESFMRDGFVRRIGTDTMASVMAPMLRRVARGELDTWDWQWAYSVWQADGVAVMPNHSLTRNAGFGTGTHCTRDSLWARIIPAAMPHIEHPAHMDACREADEFTVRTAFADGGLQPPSLFAEARRRLENGEAAANAELVRLVRETYGDSVYLEQLELYSLLAEGRIAEARDRFDGVWRKRRDPEERALLADLRLRLALQP